MDAAFQLVMADPAEFQPLPNGLRHYVPALQTKPGELTALEQAAPDVRANCTPVLEMLGPKSPGRAPFTRARVEGWIKRLVPAVGNHAFFLDRLRLAPNHLAESRHGQVPVLTAIYTAARRRGMLFVPVLHLGDGAATATQVADAAGSDGRGIALRVPLFGTALPDGRDLRSAAVDAVDATGVPLDGVDLLLDVAHIDAETEIEAADVAAMIEDLLTDSAWRNVVLLGTTMPRSLGGGIVEAGTTGRLPRKEWLLWLALRKLNLSRMPTYGDYAIQHPQPPLNVGEGQIPLGLRGAIRYTDQTTTVIPRAKAPRHEEGREQYRKLCHVLVRLPEFAGRTYTWGDQQIADCADGICEPGWEDHWRGAATSHHLRVVVDQLSALS